MPLFPIAGPLTALGDVGGQAFEGLLQGQELDRKRRLQEQQVAHQGFLERLEQARLDLAQKTQQENARRLNAYLTRGQHISIGGGRIMKVNPDGTTQIIDAGPPQETPQQRAAREAAEATARFRTKQTELLGQPKPAQIPPEHEKLFQDWQTKHPGGTYLDFYNEVVKPPKASKSHETLDLGTRTQLRAMGIDPDTATDAQIEDALTRSEERRIRLLQAGAGIREGVTERKEDRKVERGLGTMETAVGQMETVLANLDAKGFLPKPTPPGQPFSAVKEMIRAKAHQKTYRNDPDWQKWITNQGALIGIDRSVYNDLGRGGQAMFSAVKNFSESPPTAEAARAVFGQFRAAIAANRRAGRGETQSNAIKDRITVIGPNGERGSVPPGTDLSKYPGWKVAQ